MESGRLWRRAIGVCVCVLAPCAFAHTIEPLAVPNVPVGLAGSVSAIVRQPDGGLVFGGVFTMVDGVARRNIARLAPNGKLDLDWNPGADDEVKSLAADANGDIFAGGAFTQIGGQPRTGLAKLSGHGSGGANAGWHPRVLATIGTRSIDAIAFDASGAVFVSGDFNEIDGVRRNYIARMSATGTLDPAWDAQLTSDVRAMAVDPAGSIYAATGCPGFSSLCLYKMSSHGNGAIDADWSPHYFGDVAALAIAADGTLYAGGSINSFTDDDDRRDLVRFVRNGHGAIDADWKPALPFFGEITSLALDAGGALYIGQGGFEGIVFGGSGCVTKLTNTGSAVEVGWNVASDKGYVKAVYAADGALYSAGSFETSGEQATLGLARLSASNGAARAIADVEVPGEVSAIVRQPNGGTLVGGNFLKAGSALRRNLFRLTADGTLDPAWNPPAQDPVDALAVAGDDDAYIATSHLDPVLYRASTVFRVSGGGGTVDQAWSPTLSGEVDALAVDHEGAIYVGGTFITADNQPFTCIAKFLPDTALADPAWDAPKNCNVQSIAIDSLGAVYVGGSLGAFDPQPPAVAKLSPNSGHADSQWTPRLLGTAHAIALSDDGSALYAAGDFVSSSDMASPVPGIAKIAGDGTPDAHWTVLVDNETRTLAVRDDSVFVGGYTTNAAPPTHAFLAKLSASDGARDRRWNLALDGSVVTAVLATPDGSLWIGGDFTMATGELRGGLAALPAVGAGLSIPGHSRHARPRLLDPSRR